MSSVAGVPTILGAPWWDALTAVGTLLAVLAAVGVALNEARRARRANERLDAEHQTRAATDRRAAASLVAGTVDINAEPSADGSHYLQRAHLHLANESAAPVFDVYVVVAVSDPPVPVGPLAVPVPLAVLPAHHRRTWDVTLALMAHTTRASTLTTYPTIEMFFTDSQGVRWHRSFGGELHEADETPEVPISELSDDKEAQLGDLDNPFNPMRVALAFLSGVASENAESFKLLKATLAPNAPGWARFEDAELQALRTELTDYGLAAHPWFPAPFIAWVRLVHDDDARRVEERPGEFHALPMKVLTLCFLPGFGWRVFGVGATQPDWVAFPSGALGADPRADQPN